MCYLTLFFRFNSIFFYIFFHLYSQGTVSISQVLFLLLVMGGIAGPVFAVLFLWVCSFKIHVFSVSVLRA